MAQLPPDGRWVMQQIADTVILFERYTEREIVKYDPLDPNSFGPALKVIRDNEELTSEQKAMATFWAGYFYACAAHS